MNAQYKGSVQRLGTKARYNNFVPQRNIAYCQVDSQKPHFIRKQKQQNTSPHKLHFEHVEAWMKRKKKTPLFRFATDLFFKFLLIS